MNNELVNLIPESAMSHPTYSFGGSGYKQGNSIKKIAVR
jgi:hypothetical protein